MILRVKMLKQHHVGNREALHPITTHCNHCLDLPFLRQTAQAPQVLRRWTSAEVAAQWGGVIKQSGGMSEKPGDC